MDNIYFHFLSIFLIQCFMVGFTMSMTVTNLTTDQSTLLEFKDQILDPRNVLASNWTTSSSVCHWVGISCGDRHERVTVLDLSGMGLEGTLAPHLGNLSFLISLNLSGNYFQGNLPNELAKLRRLKLIDFSYNVLNGEIPKWFWNLTTLKEIYLGGNSLKGEIPREIGNLFALEIFAVQNMSLIGPIPAAIFNISSLKKMYLTDNFLEGEIPWEIGNLIKLEIFEAKNMHLNGQIPPSIFNISSLKVISLNNNFLSGKLPNMGLVSNLEGLYLRYNNLSGNIPHSISNASRLRVLTLNGNSFSGHIPNSFGNFNFLEVLCFSSNQLTIQTSTHMSTFLSSLANSKNLRVLDIASNPLNVILPASISNLPASLQTLRAHDCKIKGTIPMEIGSLSNIIALELFRNELNGSIPATIGMLQEVQGLFLDDNKLQGSIPYNVCGLEKLSELSLSGNMLQGPIPTCLGNLTSLRTLNLSSNKLSSTIPFTFWSLDYILKVDLSSNFLNGSLPRDIGNLKVLTYLNLSKNLFSSEIPTTIGSLNDLQTLSISSNRLQGSIPTSLGDLTSLETLDLSNNNFSGIIPKSLESLSYLNYFNVAFNRLEGKIPTEGCFKNFTAKSFMKNYALCGSLKLQVPPCKNSIHGLFKTHLLHVVTYGLPTIASIIWIVAFIIVLKRCRKKSTNLSSNGDLSTMEILTANLHNRLVEATNRFSDANLLGSGSFGSVYKGTLSDGTDVAIKVFNLQVEGGFRSFNAESEVMQNILHRNLVKIIGYCSCIDFKALVLEFMPNGTLEKWLYSGHYFLDILQRIDIMIDVASALEYLHLGHPNPIVHCDLKPNNILLDRDMVAHVGDFGIAKLLGEANSMKQTMTLATIGYMAPEYGSAGIVSTKSDVYSYGILLMETFTRKKPTNEIFVGEMSMKNWVKESVSDETIGFANSSLLQNEDEHFTAKENCISSIMRLALECSAELPEERKDMKDVVSVLKRIKIKYLNNVKQS
ncbi:hypothetical protein CRYUN_Cryun19dG0059600 [Craigia yunnanensis]